MVRIPDDVASRLRLPTEGAIRPARPVAAIQGDLPGLQPGMRFTARIHDALPDGTYRALVGGKLLTLALPDIAQPGDTLELVVTGMTPRGLLAQRAGAPPPGTQAPPPGSTLSRAAQLIGSLLADDAPSQPAALNRGEPLLPRPPLTAGPLAQALATAVRGSGLFYESHQAQWAGGGLPVDQLLSEPQGRHSAATILAAHGFESQSKDSGRLAPVERGGSHAAASEPRGIPEDLRPLVRQQLDAAAGQRLAWHGEAWPGQMLDLSIERDPGPRDGGAQPGEREWSTTLRVSVPMLGWIDASLSLSATGARLSLAAANAASAAALRDAGPELVRSFAAAGLNLTGFQVRHDEPA